jgi:F420-dependent oxidoreductase-like protein
VKLGVTLPYAEGAMSRDEIEEFVNRADELGYHSVWVPEAWTFDAFMLLVSFIPHTRQLQLATGIVNIYSRTPALIGQSVATLDALSDGRAILGLGASGPQVIEGWHGVPYERPLQRTRETVDIVRTILRRDKLRYEGEIFNLPLGLKLINHPLRPDVPIVVASMGPKNVAMTAEVADGWMPVLFSPDKAEGVWGESLAEGRAKRSEDLGDLEVMPAVAVGLVENDQERGVAEFMARAGLALYAGGMGSRTRNFYNDLICRHGFEQEAIQIQDLYLSGQQQEAMGKVSDAMLREFAAIGSDDDVRDRLSAYAAAGATTPVVQLLAGDHASRMRMLERIADLL